MTGLIGVLESRQRSDTKVRAALRRGLAFAPGSYTPAFPYVEPFVRASDGSWRRKALYLVAGLWAAHWREGEARPGLPIGTACARHQAASDSSSTERRFINVLDADTDQLPHRLRQLVSLLKDQPIDFEALLKGLLFWEDDDKRTQNAWARDFYRTLEAEPEGGPAPEEEVNT